MKTGIQIILAGLLIASQSYAVTVSWTDWTSSNTATNPDTAQGTMLFNGNLVSVSYSGQIAFAITGTGTNYWTEPNAAAKPYTSGAVENAPPASDIIAMSTASSRTLTFSEAVSDLYFAYVSINGNGFTFDRDFEIVSQGQGYWGNGRVAKIDNLNGTFSLNQIASNLGNEPHGIIKLTGSFTSVTWSSAANEFWYGFTVGAAARTIDLPPPPSGVPEPSTYVMVAASLLALPLLRRRRS